MVAPGVATMGWRAESLGDSGRFLAAASKICQSQRFWLFGLSGTPSGVQDFSGDGPGVSLTQPPATFWQPSGLAGAGKRGSQGFGVPLTSSGLPVPIR